MDNRGNVIGISASKGAAILSKEFNPYQTEFSIWQGWIEKIHPGINERMGYTMPERPTGPQLAWGHAFEDAIARLASERSGKEIISREEFFTWSGDGPRPDPMSHDYKLLCYLDGFYSGDNVWRMPDDAIHEAKTTSYYYWRDNFGEPGTDRVPANYQIQCQHSMICTGATETILSVLVFPKRVDEFEKEGITVKQRKHSELEWDVVFPDGVDRYANAVDPEHWANTLNQMGYFHQYHIHANKRLQSIMLDSYSEWWTKYITGCTPPEPQNYDDIMRLCPSPVGTIICDDDDLVSRKKDIYPSINADINKLNQHKEAIRSELLNWARKNTHQVDQVCPIDRHLTRTRCGAAPCGLDHCIVGDKVAAIDDNSKDKFLILDQSGKKVASWSNKGGKFSFR